MFSVPWLEHRMVYKLYVMVDITSHIRPPVFCTKQLFSACLDAQWQADVKRLHLKNMVHRFNLWGRWLGCDSCVHKTFFLKIPGYGIDETRQRQNKLRFLPEGRYMQYRELALVFLDPGTQNRVKLNLMKCRTHLG